MLQDFAVYAMAASVVVILLSNAVHGFLQGHGERTEEDQKTARLDVMDGPEIGVRNSLTQLSATYEEIALAASRRSGHVRSAIDSVEREVEVLREMDDAFPESSAAEREILETTARALRGSREPGEGRTEGEP
ncbi:hypothetical protein [Nocardiopsis sp. NPDC006938]|uniref:hypothetical protein n=1 Tax=Nocardiopsis sp. NPDC006938 TaxID=3364337 RepID=UPI00369DA5CE